MASKLLDTLVRVGISLGATTGCLGQTNDANQAHSNRTESATSQGSTNVSSNTLAGATSTGGSTGSAPAGGSAGGSSSAANPSAGGAASDSAVTSGHGGTNASENSTSPSEGGSPGELSSTGAAGFGGDPSEDPFCDSTWPTTKGNPDPPACIDPQNACKDAGPVLICARVDPDHACPGDPLAAFCVDAEWVCPEGSVPIRDCWCRGRAEDHVCTESGWQPVEN